jgi:2-polyprenyl-3-methyl-5-hydroxy-6-metoxy-1,4-benzoquinol methylase
MADISQKQILETSRAFMLSRVLLTGYELGVFTVLDGGPKTSTEVAEKVEGNERGTDRLLCALVALGFLEKQDGLYSNTEISQRYLVRGKPEYLSGMAHTMHLYASWGTLTEAVKKGGSVLPPRPYDASPEKTEAFIAAMDWRAQNQAPEVASLLELSETKRVLDVGGGSGIFSTAMAKANPNLTATVFDLPSVIPLTRRYVEQEGMTGRIDTAAGDYETDELPSGYDLVFLSAIVHSGSVESNRKLIAKCAAALNPGGRVAVMDFIMEPDRTTPPHGAMFALNMLVNTDGGDTFTVDQIVGWLVDAGLERITRTDASFGTGILTGLKPD